MKFSLEIKNIDEISNNQSVIKQFSVIQTA